MKHDLVIRGGLIVDGLGGEPYLGDVAIDGRTIAQVGKVTGEGREEIDAKGLLVTPGFVDMHTHYDCQITWDTRLSPNSHHGFTTIVMGNCAIGIAPCRPEDHDLLTSVVEGVEDIPEAVITAGVPWAWETFPEYMDFLETRHADVDFAAMIAHAPIRVYVMGERAARREISTQGEQLEMTRIVAEAIRAGAVGVSSSRTGAHRTAKGELAPAETASDAEVLALARGLRVGGGGIFEINTDFADADEGEESSDFNLLRQLVKASGGRRLLYLLMEFTRQPTLWRTLLDLTAKANAENLPIIAEVMPRANGVLWGMTTSYNPFSFRPSYRAIAELPLEERLQRMKDPAFKTQVLSEESTDRNPILVRMANMIGTAYVLDEIADYEQAPERSIAARAAAMGVDTLSLAYDLLLENDGRNIIYLPTTNYLDGNYDHVLEMMQHENALPSLGDGGAHYGLICDASYSTYLLTHWVRDRSRGARVSLPWAIKALTSEPAKAVGFEDRGVLAPGMKADVNVIDLERLTLPSPIVVHDLPGNGKRTVQYAQGYVATIVSGEVTYQNGVATGALPGRLVRMQPDKVEAPTVTREKALA